MFNSYDEAVEYISRVSWMEKERGLSRITELMNLLGNPQDRLSIIHVAGTNGKGSTCAMLDSILRKQGYVTGLFTSPHLVKYNERIRVNGSDISDEDFIRFTNVLSEVITKMDDKPTVFERLTALAFLYFEEKKCDVVILEVGMGGEYDSTNVVKTPVLSVITSIGLDHTEQLGDTIERIAATKAGIIKKGVPCVCLDQDSSVLDIFKRTAMLKDTSCIVARPSMVRLVSSDFDGITISASCLSRNVKVSLCGEYQMLNVATVLTVVRLLSVTDKLEVSEKAIEEGLACVSWPGRFEILRRNPYFIVDGAHNPHGMRAFVNSTKKLFLMKGIKYIVGIMSDKNIDEMLDIICENAACVFTVKADSSRAEQAQKLADGVRDRGVEVFVCDSVEHAIDEAMGMSKLNDVICCVGSLYLAGEVREVINHK